MMERDVIFDVIGDVAVPWCGADMDSGDLARVAEFVAGRNLPMVSVGVASVGTLWPWLENTNVRIISRFYLDGRKVDVDDISDLTVQINASFKQGASGAQVFLRAAALDDLVRQTHMVRDDLFFNKELTIGLDVCDIAVDMWGDVFAGLKKINASSVLFALTRDAGDKSDFVGRIYGMLNNWDDEFRGTLQFAFGPNFMRIEQATRLVESIRPELSENMKIWVNV
ncbi:MAG: hypothetical protein IJX89_04100 [Alphaproteobacteria bacterium]|nr:hypothetical protein [Alphaproteobacteria bacterium]